MLASQAACKHETAFQWSNNSNKDEDKTGEDDTFWALMTMLRSTPLYGESVVNKANVDTGDTS